MINVLRVSEIMSIALLTARTDTTLVDAASQMRERGVGSVLITDGPRLLGIVTERDLVTTIAQNRDPKTTCVGDVMTAPVIVVEPDSDIVYAARLMAERGIRHLPVAQEGNLIGIVSIRDIVRWGLMALGWDALGAEARQAFQVLGKAPAMTPAERL